MERALGLTITIATLTTRTLVVQTRATGRGMTAIQRAATDFWSAPGRKRR